MRTTHRYCCAISALLLVLIASCNITSVPDGGITGSFEILGKQFTFSLGDVGAIDVTADTSKEVAVGFPLLFDEPPATVPPSGTMRLPSSEVGVGQLLSKAVRTGRVLPLNGSGIIRFKIASGQSADLCDSAVLLAEYQLTYNAGVVAIVDEFYDLSAEALAILATNEVTICIEITLDFDAVITLGGFTCTFGGSAPIDADFVLSNDDTLENIHILLPGEDFDPAANRLTPGATRNETISVDAGETVLVRAGRNGSVLDSVTCPAVNGDDYVATVSWNGISLSCDATQTDDGTGVDDDDDTPEPGTTIQIPIDNLGGIATRAPVTGTYNSIDYGVVGVLYDQTPLTDFVAPESTSISVDLDALGLANVETIYMAIHSSFVPDLPNGVPMGTLTVFYAEGGSTTTLDFVLGSNTAEWSYERPEHGTVPHALVPTLYTFPTMIDSDFEYLGHEYRVNFTPDASRTISCITLSIASGATYAAYRDAASPTATWASQYIAAMTLVGPAGAPSIIGDCSGVTIPVADCDDDDFCNPLCAVGEDPDCDDDANGGDDSTEDCSADSTCNPACTAENPDPDCDNDCAADGECNDQCTPGNPDPDCEEDCSADNVCNVNCSDLNPDPDCDTPDAGTPQCTARSDFENGDDGWTLEGDAEGGRSEPDYNITGGNPGAFISADDDALGGIWYFRAPAEYHGNFEGAYGHTLTYDLKQSIDNFQLDRRDIILTGNEGTVIWFDTSFNPGTDWTPYTVSIDAAAGWMNDDDSAASEAQIRAVLADLEDIQIRGEFRNGEDTGSLDNVVLNSDCP